MNNRTLLQQLNKRITYQAKQGAYENHIDNWYYLGLVLHRHQVINDIIEGKDDIQPYKGL